MLVKTDSIIKSLDSVSLKSILHPCVPFWGALQDLMHLHFGSFFLQHLKYTLSKVTRNIKISYPGFLGFAFRSCARHRKKQGSLQSQEEKKTLLILGSPFSNAVDTLLSHTAMSTNAESEFHEPAADP